jgi:hypothetical protein
MRIMLPENQPDDKFLSWATIKDEPGTYQVFMSGGTNKKADDYYLVVVGLGRTSLAQLFINSDNIFAARDEIAQAYCYLPYQGPPIRIEFP